MNEYFWHLKFIVRLSLDVRQLLVLKEILDERSAGSDTFTFGSELSEAQKTAKLRAKSSQMRCILFVSLSSLKLLRCNSLVY